MICELSSFVYCFPFAKLSEVLESSERKGLAGLVCHSMRTRLGSNARHSR